jgi:hypothetical protein
MRFETVFFIHLCGSAQPAAMAGLAVVVNNALRRLPVIVGTAAS